MCDFVSFVIDKRHRDKVRLWDAFHHTDTADHFSIPRDQYIEGEWNKNDRMIIRTSEKRKGVECAAELEAMVRRQYPTREALLKELWTDEGKRAAVEWEGGIQIVVSAERGKLDEMKALIEIGADVDAKNHDGFTPLHCVAVNGNVDMVKLLLKYNANIEAKESDGNTPLHCAVMTGKVGIVKLLLRHNADVNGKNLAGYTPLDLAKRYGCTEMIEAIEAKLQEAK